MAILNIYSCVNIDNNINITKYQLYMIILLFSQKITVARKVPLLEMAEEIYKFYFYIAPLRTITNAISITVCVQHDYRKG